jgi:hypothetical protein
MNFTQLQQNVERVISELDTIVLDSAMVLKSTIADLNVKQLEQGKRIDGENIIPKYESPIYDKAKKDIGSISPPMVPDLKLEGNFHKGIYAGKKSKDYIYTWSSDEKADKLNAKYKKIFGLTKDSILQLKPDLHSELYKRLLNELHKS